MTRRSDSPVRVAFFLALLLTALPGVAAAQSEASRASDASVDASLDVPAAMATALSAGAEFVVAGVAASGETVAVSIAAVGTGASYVVRVSAGAAARMGIAVGAAVVVTVVAAGWLLSVGGEALCFIANAAARDLIHTRRIET